MPAMDKDAILSGFNYMTYTFSHDDAKRNNLDGTVLEACDTALNAGLERRLIAESLLHVARMIVRNKQEFGAVLAHIAKHYGDRPDEAPAANTSPERVNPKE